MSEPNKSAPYELVYMPLEELARRKHPRNPRLHHLPSIEGSIDVFGFVEPIVINRTTGLIVSGHGRVKALVELKRRGFPLPKGVREQGGQWLAPAFMVDVPERYEEALILALNRAVELGGWEPEMSAEAAHTLWDTDPELFAVLDVDTIVRTARELSEQAQRSIAELEQKVETQSRERTQSAAALVYNANPYRQIVLVYDEPTYARVIGYFEQLRDRYQLDNNADTLLALLDELFSGAPPALSGAQARE